MRVFGQLMTTRNLVEASSRRHLRIVVCLLLGMALAWPALSCECARSPLKRTFGYSRAFFIGTVLYGDGLSTTAQVRVLESFKGVRRGSVLDVDAGGPCGMILNAGQTYLIQAYRSSRGDLELEFPNVFRTSICACTLPVENSFAQKLVRSLRRWSWCWRIEFSVIDRSRSLWSKLCERDR